MAVKPKMEKILEFDGLRMDCTVESTPHANAQAYNCTYEGAELIPKHDTKSRRSLAREQTGIEIPLRTIAAFNAPSNPWPKRNEQDTRDTAFAMTKRKLHWKKPGQSNSWDQCRDSSPVASPSAKKVERHSVSEKANKWGQRYPEGQTLSTHTPLIKGVEAHPLN